MSPFCLSRKVTERRHPTTKSINFKFVFSNYADIHFVHLMQILDKSFGDEVKYFEVKTKNLLGRDFRSTKNFIVKLEAIAERFLEQVVVHQ